MNKNTTIILAIIVILGISMVFFAPPFITKMITEYKPYTFDYVLKNDSLTAHFGLTGQDAPDDFGFEFREIDYYSLLDSIQLNAWYVPAKQKSRNCLVLVHGRTSNRLKTMKYLNLVKKQGLDSVYNIFIPDFRNSGKSEEARTYMGYKFAEDLTATLIHLKQQHQQDTFLIYAFSMGAMATATMLNREELHDTVKAHTIHIQKLIFDSPLSNVKATLKQNSDEMGMPGFLFDRVYDHFCQQIHGYCDQLALGTQLQDVNIPILILQSVSDETTKYEFLKDEMSKLKSKENIYLKTFENVDHVKIYQSEKYQDAYVQTVGNFVRH